MAIQTEGAAKIFDVSPSTAVDHKKAVADLMAELDLEDQQAAERTGQGRAKHWTQALTASPEILILVVWIAMMYALWTQFRGPILSLLK
jgi:hypothetical protein